MSRAELLRRHAHEAELRARTWADQSGIDELDPDASRRYIQASDMEAICARVLYELAEIEDEDGCRG